MNKIDYLLEEKRAELKMLEQEMYEALRIPGDKDYEFAALLYPLIGEIQREIAKIDALGRRPDPPPGNGLDTQVWQLLTGQYRLLEIWVGIQNNLVPQTTCLVEIRKLKARHLICCTIRIPPCFKQYLRYETAIILEHIGWHSMQGGKMFRRKAILRNLDDLETFCQWISVTLLDAFDGFWRYSEGQYYRLRK